MIKSGKNRIDTEKDKSFVTNIKQTDSPTNYQSVNSLCC